MKKSKRREYSDVLEERLRAFSQWDIWKIAIFAIGNDLEDAMLPGVESRLGITRLRRIFLWP